MAHTHTQREPTHTHTEAHSIQIFWANLILCFVWFSHIIWKFYCGNWTRLSVALERRRRRRRRRRLRRIQRGCLKSSCRRCPCRKIEAPTVFWYLCLEIVNVCEYHCVYICVCVSILLCGQPRAFCAMCCWSNRLCFLGLFTFISFGIIGYCGRNSYLNGQTT